MLCSPVDALVAHFVVPEATKGAGVSGCGADV